MAPDSARSARSAADVDALEQCFLPETSAAAPQVVDSTRDWIAEFAPETPTAPVGAVPPPVTPPDPLLVLRDEAPIHPPAFVRAQPVAAPAAPAASHPAADNIQAPAVRTDVVAFARDRTAVRAALRVAAPAAVLLLLIGIPAVWLMRNAPASRPSTSNPPAPVQSVPDAEPKASSANAPAVEPAAPIAPPPTRELPKAAVTAPPEPPPTTRAAEREPAAKRPETPVVRPPAVAARPEPIPEPTILRTAPPPPPPAGPVPSPSAAAGAPVDLGSSMTGVDTPAPRFAPLPPPLAREASSANQLESVRTTLARFAAAYSDLDADAAQRVWPGVNRAALARAFQDLSSQEVRLGDCRIDVGTETARASCRGSIDWTPRVGGGRPKTESRTWDFTLNRRPGGWQIASARVGK